MESNAVWAHLSSKAFGIGCVVGGLLGALVIPCLLLSNVNLEIDDVAAGFFVIFGAMLGATMGGPTAVVGYQLSQSCNSFFNKRNGYENIEHPEVNSRTNSSSNLMIV